MERIGLIAGNRRFPLLVSQQAKKQGIMVISAAIKGETSPEIKKICKQIYELETGRKRQAKQSKSFRQQIKFSKAAKRK